MVLPPVWLMQYCERIRNLQVGNVTSIQAWTLHTCSTTLLIHPTALRSSLSARIRIKVRSPTMFSLIHPCLITTPCPLTETTQSASSTNIGESMMCIWEAKGAYLLPIWTTKHVPFRGTSAKRAFGTDWSHCPLVQYDGPLTTRREECGNTFAIISTMLNCCASAALLDDDLAAVGDRHIALHCSAAGCAPAGSRQHTAWSARAQGVSAAAVLP